ncbi:hypothetical protein [Methylocapsa sp. S129]|uniref:COG3904 family protein n=1 Tax=Methylocapsa sp. S129 TaxID=1641869 RepID=UPI00131CE2E9|nr:hypothetical protein [Methylocapsa sp. S129]
MAKTRSQAILFLFALVFGGAGFFAHLEPATAQSSAMSFRLAKLEGRACGARCPRVIVAEGIIEEDTPEAFVDFLKSVADAPNLRDVIVLNSPGGRVVASMRLGAALRKLRAAVVVARFDKDDDLDFPSAGQCMSACVYALMGGARRIVPPQSRLGIHRMSSKDNSASLGRLFAAATPSYASPDMVDALAGYAAQMGVSPTVIRVAERIPPEEIHIVSPAELRRWRLASPKF